MLCTRKDSLEGPATQSHPPANGRLAGPDQTAGWLATTLITAPLQQARGPFGDALVMLPWGRETPVRVSH